MVSKDDIKKLADLSRIEISEEEASKLSEEIDSILSYVDEIKSVVDTDDSLVAPDNSLPKNVTREDVLGDSISSPSLLIDSMPNSEDNYLKVRKIL